MIKKKLIIYLRKSRNDGDYETVEEVLARHEKQLQEFCLRVFGYYIDEIYIYREVVSGETIEDRPMMKNLLSDIEKGDVEGVLVIEPQRLSRGSFADIDKIVNTFKYTNTKVITPVKTYDLNNKFDRKYFEQELLRGNEYLEYIKEILARGKIRSVEDGCYIGSITPYGYDKAKLPKKGFMLVPNDAADNVRYIFNKFIEGLGTTELAKHLIDIGIKSKTGKQWSANMVRNILTNEIYIGILTYGRREVKKNMVNGEIVNSRPWNDDYIKVQGLHEPLITIDTFNKAKNMLKAAAHKNVPRNSVIKNPLAGLVKCKLCNTNMTRRPYDKRKVETLICNTIGCKCVSSDLNLVENRVIELLKNKLSNYKYYVANYEEEYESDSKDFIKKIDKIDKELNQLKEDLQNALVKYNRNKITEEEYNFLRKYTLDEENRLNDLKTALNDKIKNSEMENKRKAIPILEKCLEEYYTLDAADRNKLLSAIIDKIIYYKAKGGRWDVEARDKFELELFLKI